MSSLPTRNVVEKREDGTIRVSIGDFGKGKTQQHHKSICDINNIMKKYDKSGLINHVAAVQGIYGDFSEIGTYHEAVNKLNRTQDNFLKLPAHIRAEFENDPGVMLEELGKPENYDRFLELGLVERKASLPDEVSPSEPAGEGSAQ